MRQPFVESPHVLGSRFRERQLVWAGSQGMQRDQPPHEESRGPLSGFVLASLRLDPEISCLLPIALAILFTQLDTKCTSLDSE